MKNLPTITVKPRAEVQPPPLWNLLGIPSNLPPDDRTRRLLQQLQSADFLPPPAWHDAVEILAGATSKKSGAFWLSRPAFCREVEDQLRIAIDELANRFFTILPDDRLSQWNELARQSGFSPALRARLALLEPGLALGSLTNNAMGDDLAMTMVHAISRIFPVDAATRRQLIGETLGPMFDRPHDWEDAARGLSRDRPEIAALVPEFVAAVAALCDPEREEARRREARARTAALEAEWDSQNRWYYESDLTPEYFRRYKYHLLGIFGIFLALVLLADVIVERAPTAGPAPRFRGYRFDDSLSGNPRRRHYDAPINNDSLQPPDSSRDSIERRQSP